MKPETAESGCFTYDDLLNFPDDGKRREVIEGELYVAASPNTKHQDVSLNLAVAFRVYLKQHPIGAVFTAPFDVVLSAASVVEPDLVYVSRERAGIVTPANIRGVPDLIIEIGSPGSRRVDETTKRRLYEHFGAREYWVVDPELDAVKIYRLGQDGAFDRAAELSVEHGDSLTTPLMPGFSAPLAEIFAPQLPNPVPS